MFKDRTSIGRASIVQKTHTQIGIIIGIGCLIFFTHLGSARLWDRDEPRNAGCAVEMMERGDLVVPMFNDELRPQKPALLYWLIISAYQIFGVGEFAARFWSAVLAIGTMLATYGIGRRLFNPSVALYSAIVLGTSMMFVVAGRAATPDSVLVFCCTVATLLYVLGTFAPKANAADAPTLRWAGYYFPQRLPWVIGIYAMLGLAVLAKGPVGFILPCAIIGMFMLIMRLPPIDNEQWNSRGWLTRIAVASLRPFHPSHFLSTLLAMRPFILAATVLVVAAPWYIIVGIQTNWDWPTQFLFTENLARATSTFENHDGGIFYYPFMLILGFFPWSVFFGPMILEVDRRVTRKHHWGMAYVFLLCWIGVQVGLFSLAQTKLPSYITPCYPALALLTGTFLHQIVTRTTSTTESFQRMSFGTMIFSGLLITAALVFAGNQYLSGDLRLAMVGLVPIVGGVFALLFHLRDDNQHAVLSLCAFAVVFVTSVFGFGTTVVDKHRKSNDLLLQVADQQSTSAVATFGCLESSWVYYGGRPIYELAPQDQRGDWKDNRKNEWDRKQWPSPEQFTATHPDSMIITTRENLEELQARLPEEFQVIESAPYFLRRKELVLLSPSKTKRRVAQAPDDSSTTKR